MCLKLHFWGFEILTLSQGGSAKNETALAPSCHVVVLTTKFGEFLHNCLGGDSMMDGQKGVVNNIPPHLDFFFFQKAWG